MMMALHRLDSQLGDVSIIQYTYCTVNLLTETQEKQFYMNFRIQNMEMINFISKQASLPPPPNWGMTNYPSPLFLCKDVNN